MKAEIVTIGDEILIGQIVDTNSAWMAAELNAIGISIAQITSVSDSPQHLVDALNLARKRADVVLMTGGLGPTKDDRTKKVLTDYFHSTLVIDERTLEHVSQFFKKRGLGVNQLNKDQALVPECCEVLFNPLGSAPGMWFEEDNTVFVSMPGVPFEMKQIMTDQVLPRLAGRSGRGKIVHKTVHTIGIPESILAETIEDFENALPEYIHLAYLPSPGLIRLRFSAYGNDKILLQNEVDRQLRTLRTLIPDAIFGYDDTSLAAEIGKILLARKETVATAESCTGGYIAHLITSVPGSSTWYKGSVVAYANEVKRNALNVSEQALKEYGAVSEVVVKQMAEGVRSIMNSTWGIATSGIAGPDGGTPEKPVGTVWIAVAGPDGVIAEKHSFSNDRERNILRASLTALNRLRLKIIDPCTKPLQE
ncbi:MAG TPA: competence/damage-inducible protein A [Prolixibacteraceae bacterium]|nr:competence/damage-inducible protein A [Prolixibacteraceae bacterium]